MTNDRTVDTFFTKPSRGREREEKSQPSSVARGKISQIDHRIQLACRRLFTVFVYTETSASVEEAMAFLTRFFLYMNFEIIITLAKHMFLVARKNSKHIRETRDFNCRFGLIYLCRPWMGRKKNVFDDAFPLSHPFDTINLAKAF